MQPQAKDETQPKSSKQEPSPFQVLQRQAQEFQGHAFDQVKDENMQQLLLLGFTKMYMALYTLGEIYTSERAFAEELWQLIEDVDFPQDLKEDSFEKFYNHIVNAEKEENYSKSDRPSATLRPSTPRPSTPRPSTPLRPSTTFRASEKSSNKSQPFFTEPTFTQTLVKVLSHLRVCSIKSKEIVEKISKFQQPLITFGENGNIASLKPYVEKEFFKAPIEEIVNKLEETINTSRFMDKTIDNDPLKQYLLSVMIEGVIAKIGVEEANKNIIKFEQIKQKILANQNAIKAINEAAEFLEGVSQKNPNIPSIIIVLGRLIELYRPTEAENDYFTILQSATLVGAHAERLHIDSGQNVMMPFNTACNNIFKGVLYQRDEERQSKSNTKIEAQEIHGIQKEKNSEEPEFKITGGKSDREFSSYVIKPTQRPLKFNDFCEKFIKAIPSLPQFDYLRQEFINLQKLINQRSSSMNELQRSWEMAGKLQDEASSMESCIKSILKQLEAEKSSSIRQSVMNSPIFKSFVSFEGREIKDFFDAKIESNDSTYGSKYKASLLNLRDNLSLLKSYIEVIGALSEIRLRYSAEEQENNGYILAQIKLLAAIAIAIGNKLQDLEFLNKFFEEFVVFHKNSEKYKEDLQFQKQINDYKTMGSYFAKLQQLPYELKSGDDAIANEMKKQPGIPDISVLPQLICNFDAVEDLPKKLANVEANILGLRSKRKLNQDGSVVYSILYSYRSFIRVIQRKDKKVSIAFDKNCGISSPQQVKYFLWVYLLLVASIKGNKDEKIQILEGNQPVSEKTKKILEEIGEETSLFVSFDNDIILLQCFYEITNISPRNSAESKHSRNEDNEGSNKKLEDHSLLAKNPIRLSTPVQTPHETPIRSNKSLRASLLPSVRKDFSNPLEESSHTARNVTPEKFHNSPYKTSLWGSPNQHSTPISTTPIRSQRKTSVFSPIEQSIMEGSSYDVNQKNAKTQIPANLPKPKINQQQIKKAEPNNDSFQSEEIYLDTASTPLLEEGKQENKKDEESKTAKKVKDSKQLTDAHVDEQEIRVAPITRSSDIKQRKNSGGNKGVRKKSTSTKSALKKGESSKHSFFQRYAATLAFLTITLLTALVIGACITLAMQYFGISPQNVGFFTVDLFTNAGKFAHTALVGWGTITFGPAAIAVFLGSTAAGFVKFINWMTGADKDYKEDSNKVYKFEVEQNHPVALSQGPNKYNDFQNIVSAPPTPTKGNKDKRPTKH